VFIERANQPTFLILFKNVANKFKSLGSKVIKGGSTDRQNVK
jgi:hypothetical protein